MEDKIQFGTVLWFNKAKNYGFIRQSAQEGRIDIFVHGSDIAKDSKQLQKNDSVQYEIGLNNRSQEKAINVYVLKKE